MTVTPRIGDLLKSKAHALVNTVNCVGVMGKGIALEFKKQYPAMYEDYVRRCEAGEVKLGRPYPYQADDGHLIINFPTKEHWRGVSRIDAIVDGLDWLAEHYREWGIRSLAVPPLGCGNGQLEWKIVGPTLHRGLSRLPIPVELYAPLDTPPSEMQLDFFTDESRFKRTADEMHRLSDPAWIAIAEVIDRISKLRHHWPVGRVRFQKIAYFLAALDVPLNLSYERGSYGPYAAGVKPMEARLINNGLLVQHQIGKMTEVLPGGSLDDARIEYADVIARWDGEINRVTDLFARTTTQQSEIAASVHMATRDLEESLNRRPTEIEVRDEVLRWKVNRPTLNSANVGHAVETLAVLGWIDVEPCQEIRSGRDAESAT